MTNQPPPGQYGPGDPAYQPATGNSGNGVPQKGFFGSLFDFGFNSFITSKVIKFLYVLAVIMAGLVALGLLVVAFKASPVIGILGLVVGCPLYFFLTVAFSRITLEFVMVVFRMAEDMRAIRNRGEVGMP
jgi:ABC-type uncharacterized transport system permease subunit